MKVVKFNVVDASGAAAVGATIGMGNTEVKTAAGGIAQMLLDDGDVVLTVNGKKAYEGPVDDLKPVETFTTAGARQ